MKIELQYQTSVEKNQFCIIIIFQGFVWKKLKNNFCSLENFFYAMDIADFKLLSRSRQNQQ
jgi:hypothetical protein